MTSSEQNTTTETKLALQPMEFFEAKVDSFQETTMLPQVLESVIAMGWTKPTPVQGLCLPFSLQGRDVAGFAQTGTGKTGVFLITIANQILKAKAHDDEASPSLQAVVLTPTRELAMQIAQDAEVLLKPLGISCLAVFGGVDYEKQATAIKSGVQVIVATPGRLKDYAQKRILNLEDCKLFVCDEADRMFEMGFVEDVTFFFDKVGPKTQKLLFSATTNEQAKELAFEYLENPEYISVTPETITPENIDQRTIIVESQHKVKVLLGLFRDEKPGCAIIFTNTKLVADWLQYKLVKNNIEADVITGDLPQRKRINLIQKIKKGDLKVLIATDVASRGLHIAGVSHVINFDLPDEPANYVHRIGRTARAGAKGKAFSFVCEDYGHNLEAIQNYVGEGIIPNSTWHTQNYLEVEDISGNPFDDPEFKSYSTPKPARDRNQRDSRNRDGRARPHKDERHSTKSRRDKSSPDNQKRQSARSHHDGSKKRDSQKKHANRHKPKQAAHGHKQHKHAKAQAPEAAKYTISGIIKKIFGTLFGRGRKES